MNKTKKFYFHEQRHREACLVFLNTIEIGPDKQVWEVICRPYKKDRSSAQNRLMWKWLTIIAREYAQARDEAQAWYDPETWKEEFQSKFLGYRVIKTPSGDRPHLIGTSELNTAEFTAFLNDMEHYSGSVLNIALPHPEDSYYEAMGR